MARRKTGGERFERQERQEDVEVEQELQGDWQVEHCEAVWM